MRHPRPTTVSLAIRRVSLSLAIRRVSLSLALFGSFALAVGCRPAETRSTPMVGNERVDAVPVERPNRVHFDWPAPASVAVEETVSNGKAQLTLRYRLHIEREPSTSQIKVQYRGWQAVNLKDIRLNRELDSETKQIMLNAAETPPSFIVGEDGKIVGLADLEAFAKQRPSSPFAEPRDRDEWLQHATSRWYCWVQIWLYDKLPAAGASVGIAPKEELARLSNQGPPADSAAHLQLAYRWGPEDRRALVQQLEDEIAIANIQPQVEVVQSSAQYDMSVEIETKTGKPRLARSRLQEATKYRSREPRSSELNLVYRFSW